MPTQRVVVVYHGPISGQRLVDRDSILCTAGLCTVPTGGIFAYFDFASFDSVRHRGIQQQWRKQKKNIKGREKKKKKTWGPMAPNTSSQPSGHGCRDLQLHSRNTSDLRGPEVQSLRAGRQGSLPMMGQGIHVMCGNRNAKEHLTMPLLGCRAGRGSDIAWLAVLSIPSQRDCGKDPSGRRLQGIMLCGGNLGWNTTTKPDFRHCLAARQPFKTQYTIILTVSNCCLLFAMRLVFSRSHSQ